MTNNITDNSTQGTTALTGTDATSPKVEISKEAKELGATITNLGTTDERLLEAITNFLSSTESSTGDQAYVQFMLNERNRKASALTNLVDGMGRTNSEISRNIGGN